MSEVRKAKKLPKLVTDTKPANQTEEHHCIPGTCSPQLGRPATDANSFSCIWKAELACRWLICGVQGG